MDLAPYPPHLAAPAPCPPASPGLAGSAFIALWNDVAPGHEAEYDRWHTREHVPQRVSIPGIASGRRYVAADRAGGAQRYFTLYDLDGPDVLDGDAYRAVVQNPTPWSAAMRPHLRRFLRLPCRRVLSLGSSIGGTVATLRVPAMAPSILRPYLAALGKRDGITAVHLGEPCRGGPAFPLGGPPDDEGGLVLVEGTDAAAVRAALWSAAAPLRDAAASIYALAFLTVARVPERA